MLRKWEYVRDRLASEGDVVGSMVAAEIDKALAMHDYPPHTRRWVNDWVSGGVEEVAVDTIIGSAAYCTACVAEGHHCPECEFGTMGGSEMWIRLANHRMAITRGVRK